MTATADRHAGGHGRGWAPPRPGSPERVALPLHLQPIAGALFDDLPGPPPAAAVDAAARALATGRDRLAEVRPAGGELVVDSYRLRLAAGCPAAAVGGDDSFRWTPSTAARHLGLRAVALHHCGDGARRAGRAVEEAVAAVVDELVRDGGERTPGPWLAALDDAGRAVARAQARRWAEQAVAWLPLRIVHRRALRFLDDDWWPGGPRGGRALVVHGRRDVTIDAGGRRIAVTVAGGATTTEAADVDAFTALAAALCDSRSRLVRVVRVHPASGEVAATDVTPPLLQRGVAVTLATATAMADPAAPPRPGPACPWCARLPLCPAGTTWLTHPTRRTMGLPAGPPPLQTVAAPT